jgi:hypothetical protein
MTACIEAVLHIVRDGLLPVLERLAQLHGWTVAPPRKVGLIPAPWFTAQHAAFIPWNGVGRIPNAAFVWARTRTRARDRDLSETLGNTQVLQQLAEGLVAQLQQAHAAGIPAAMNTVCLMVGWDGGNTALTMVAFMTPEHAPRNNHPWVDPLSPRVSVAG